MRKFKVDVTRTDSYIIELDDTVLHEEWMSEFREVYYNFHDLDEHAEHLGQLKARFPDSPFMEGYGTPLSNGKRPYFTREEDLNHEINIIDQDIENVDVEVEEIYHFS